MLCQVLELQIGGEKTHNLVSREEKCSVGSTNEKSLQGEAAVNSGNRNDGDDRTLENCKWLTAQLQACTCLSSSPPSEPQDEGEPDFVHM